MILALNLVLVRRRETRSFAVGRKRAMRRSVSSVMPSPSSGHGAAKILYPPSPPGRTRHSSESLALPPSSDPERSAPSSSSLTPTTGHSSWRVLAARRRCRRPSLSIAIRRWRSYSSSSSRSIEGLFEKMSINHIAQGRTLHASSGDERRTNLQHMVWYTFTTYVCGLRREMIGKRMTGK